jgi:hypothetical protein
MLAMHYRISLPNPEAVDTIRARAAERGPLFDGMAGLAYKVFLVDPADPCYATFYLWKDPGAALAFLNGPFFAALTQTFGRPEVTLLLSEAADLPFATGSTVFLDTLRDGATHAAQIEALDPKSGATVTLSNGPSGRRFDVMYRATGVAAGNAA